MTAIWFDSALLPSGWARSVRIEIRAGRIATVTAGVDPRPGEDRRSIGIPGLANVHSHGFQRGLAGLTETRGPVGDTFWTWRVEMYRFLDRLTPEDIEALSALAYVEMLESGFTRVGEFHYLHHDPAGVPYADVGTTAAAIAAAAGSTGIGLTLLPVFYAHANFGGAPPLPGQRRFVCDRDRYARLFHASAAAIAGLDAANLGAAPHSLRAVTPDELGFAASLAPGGPLHIHVSEQTKEVDDCLAWCGRRPVELLLDSVDVDARWCLIHATHLTEGETRALARSGAVVGLCPVTEANLGDGIFPAPEFSAAGGRLGVGTDSNIQIDAANELRSLEYAQRLARRARNVLAPAEGASTGASLFRSALAGGAQALAVDGGLATGSPADIVALDAEHPSLCGVGGDRLLDAWVFSAGAAAVDAVWCHGARVVDGGRHVRSEAIRATFRRALRGLAS
jgi:formimidoylglutamate deiminase